MDDKLVSFCVPCYNAEQYLQETISCLLTQTYQNIEIIIVDDGSKDKSIEILKNAANIDTRIKCFYQNNLGAANARNKAFKYSEGEYIIFFDADDIVEENYIQLLINKIKSSSHKIGAGQLRRFFTGTYKSAKSEPMETWKDLKPVDWLLIDNGKGLGMMQCGMFLIPRELILKAGLWNEKLSLIDDFEFFPRVLLQASEIIFVNEAVVYYRSGIENSLSNTVNIKGLNSAYSALELTTKTILRTEKSKRSRAVLANYWALWAYQFYYTTPTLYNNAVLMIKELSGATFKPKLTGLTKKISAIFGWKLTKRIKLSLGRS